MGGPGGGTSPTAARRSATEAQRTLPAVGSTQPMSQDVLGWMKAMYGEGLAGLFAGQQGQGGM